MPAPPEVSSSRLPAGIPDEDFGYPLARRCAVIRSSRLAVSRVASRRARRILCPDLSEGRMRRPRLHRPVGCQRAPGDYPRQVQGTPEWSADWYAARKYMSSLALFLEKGLDRLQRLVRSSHVRICTKKYSMRVAPSAHSWVRHPV
jgi:hypothetical protein